MLKVFTAEQIRKADAYTIENEPVSSLELMERAAISCVNELRTVCGFENRFIIFCGNGNNGGDGYAIARLLLQANCKVIVVPVNHQNQLSSDCRTNAALLNKIPGIVYSDTDSVFDVINQADIIIDGIFGTGL